MKYNLFQPRTFFLTVMLLSANSFADAKPQFQAPLFNNLGTSHYPIATQNPNAQRFYDQGMILFYGFEWGEAVRSFKEARRLDPTCAMCYWGEAIALSYKGNAPMTGHEVEDAKVSINQAQKFKHSETAVHQAFIDALTDRYQHTSTTKQGSEVLSCHGTNSDDPQLKEKIAFATAMKKIAARFNEDHDAKVLSAVAEFWSFIDSHPAGYRRHKQDSGLVDVTKMQLDVLKKDKLNVGANHYYIHLVEPYDNPALALESADRLRTLVPGSEHLVHMPAHIYFLLGRFHDASLANQAAIAADHHYVKECHRQGFEPSVNYLHFHNYDFLRASAVMEGRKALSVLAIKQLFEEPYSTWMKKEPDLQFYIPLEYFVYARFGMWDDILKLKEPNAKFYYAKGMRHYVRGLAFVHTHQLEQAKNEYSAFDKIIDFVKHDRTLGDKEKSILTLARTLLSAALADLQGENLEVIKQLKLAVKFQDDMRYHEPPDWYFPIKDALAEAYLKQGHYKLATLWYKKSLQQYPNSGWALYGLQQSLQKEGKVREAESAKAEFEKAWKNADIPKPVGFF